MLLKVLLIGICYLIGNFSPSYWMARIVKKVDIREVGSGNAGSTNTLRLMGKKAGAIVFLLDILKGTLCSFIGLKFGGYDFAFLCSLAVVFGHVFPALMGFKGGKGVATAIGSIVVIQPLFVLIGLIVALLAIAKTKYVSLGSVVGLFTFAALMYFTGHRGLDMGSSTGLFLFIVYTHRANIGRIINKTERKLGEKSSS